MLIQNSVVSITIKNLMTIKSKKMMRLFLKLNNNNHKSNTNKIDLTANHEMKAN